MSAGLAVALWSTSAAAEPAVWYSPVRPQLELSTHLTEQLDLRFGLSNLAPERLVDRSGGASSAARGTTASALIDWQLPAGGFRLTGGALYGEPGWSSVDGASPDGFPGLRRIGSRSAGLGGESGDSLTPYVGLGWDNDFGDGDRFGLQLDLGIMFRSISTFEPQEAASTDAPMEQVHEDTLLSETFESFRYSPMFSAGFRYRF